MLGSGPSEGEEVDDDDLEIYWTINKVSQPRDSDNDSSMSETESHSNNIVFSDEECGECLLKDFDNYVLNMKTQEYCNKLAEKVDSLAKNIVTIQTEMNKKKKLPLQEDYDILVKRVEKIENEMYKEKLKIVKDNEVEI